MQKKTYAFAACSWPVILTAIRPLIWTVVGLCLSSCQRRVDYGFLEVKSSQNGQYEIYKLTSEEQYERVAEKRGHFNQVESLIPGGYLLLFDCSSEKVVIYPSARKEIVVHTLQYLPPRTPSEKDQFSIACLQNEEMQSSQEIKDRYQLFVLPGQRKLLVNQVDQGVTVKLSAKPERYAFQLSGLKVDTLPQQAPNTVSPFFVSYHDEKASTTLGQQQGLWQFLLPGTYTVELNGTRERIKLEEKSELILNPALVRFSLPEGTEVDLAEQVLGSPLYVDFNFGHHMSYDQDYAILPGSFSYRPNQYSRWLEDQALAGESKSIALKTVTIDNGCSPWDGTCLGASKVYVFGENEPYPYIKGLSDIPIAFREDLIELAVQGASKLKIKLATAEATQVIRVGRVRIVPTPRVDHYQQSDLLRIEAAGEGISGFSNDLSLSEDSVLSLPAATYHIANYTSVIHDPGNRKRSITSFQVEAGKDAVVEVPVFMTEARFLARSGATVDSKNSESPEMPSKGARNASARNSPIYPAVTVF